MDESPDAGMVERDLADYYDQEAADRAERKLGERRIEARTRFRALLPPSPSFLEVGPGAGRDSGAFVEAGIDVVGVDLSHEQSRHASMSGAGPVVATVRQMPFADGSFDALWTMSTLMHVPDSAIELALAELRRVLSPGALAAIGVWGGPDIEGTGDKDAYDPPRLFSRRSDARWETLLATLGTVEQFENWHPELDDFWYQFAIVRR